MRLMRFRSPHGIELAADTGDGELWPVAGTPHVDEAGQLRISLDRSRSLGSAEGRDLAAPVAPGKIVAIGANYRDHIREAGMVEPAAPLIFAKFPSSVIGPNDAIVIDQAQTERVDWEVELAVVIGRRMRNVAERAVFDYVLGYTAANDVSARDVQFGDGQWVRGKSLDTFCPLGPVLVTRDEIADPQALRLRTFVNGAVVQDSSTTEMVFSVVQILSYVSRQFTLEPGDVVLTGTPWGCGEFMTPRRSLQPGDLVEVEVEGIGRLANRVTEAPALPVAAE
jgi:2-keto-4-pentenoate hydratase/2-oxohepta-3-ene-1,7-dioic acid hydratase in catechol pathway